MVVLFFYNIHVKRYSHVKFWMLQIEKTITNNKNNHTLHAVIWSIVTYYASEGFCWYNSIYCDILFSLYTCALRVNRTKVSSPANTSSKLSWSLIILTQPTFCKGQNKTCNNNCNNQSHISVSSCSFCQLANPQTARQKNLEVSCPCRLHCCSLVPNPPSLAFVGSIGR